MKISKNLSLKSLVNFTITILVISVFGCTDTIDHTAKSSKIIVQNYYWPKQGLEKEVYQQRLLASSVREKYGHPVGRVLWLTTESDSLPKVIWECEYASLKARNKDVERIANNDEFSEVAEKMGTLIKKFDRAIYDVSAPRVRVE